MKIPIIKPDLPRLEEVEKEFNEILQSGKITNFGKYVTAFENAAGEYLGTNVATVSSGTMGLLFALKSAGLKPGKKVIVPSFTFIATVQAILYAGGIPLFAEIGADMTLSTADLEKLLNENQDVDIVLPVHTYGLPCKVHEIEDIVERASQKYSRKISLIYDAAHAFGSAMQGKKVGTFGDAEVFSLSATKALVSVEGGLVSSHDAELINRIKKMRNYGIEENYNAHRLGMNGKMSEFHAIIGLYNLKKLDERLKIRKEMAEYYLKKIAERTEFRTQHLPQDVTHTFKDFTVLVPESYTEKRTAIMEGLKKSGIETKAYFYPPAHEQTFFKQFADRELPVTENISRRVITLPFYTTITQDEIDYVVSALEAINRSVL